MGWIEHPDCQASTNAEASRNDEIRIGDELPPCNFKAGTVACQNIIKMTETGLKGTNKPGFGCLYLEVRYGDLSQSEDTPAQPLLDPFTDAIE